MKYIVGLIITSLFLSASHAATEGNPYIHLNPVPSLKENECVFKLINAISLEVNGYKKAVDSCDKLARHLSIPSDHLEPGECAYDLHNKKTGHFIIRVAGPCPKQIQQKINQQNNIVDEEIETIAPAPEDEQVKVKPAAKQKITKKESAQPDQQEQPAVQNDKEEKDNEEVPEIKNYIPPAVDQDF